MRRFLLFVWVAFFSAPALAIVTFDDAKVVLQTPRAKHPLFVQIAKTPEQLQHGLMFRKELKPYDGMLFEFSTPQLVTMWMKNTPLPLDMIFMDAQLKVIHVASNTTPYSLETISSQLPARYVLEVAAGTAKAWGIRSGDLLVYEK